MKRYKGSVNRFFNGLVELSFREAEKIEITGKGVRRKVVLEGVRRILQYGEEEIRLERADGCVAVHGRMLDCVSYVSGAIGISGEIEALVFQSKKGEEK